MSNDHVEHARTYLRALEQGATGDALARFFTPDVVQEEFPNRLVPTGARRDLAALLDGAVRGQSVVENQRYDVQTVTAQGDRVVLEVIWTATPKITLGSLQAGSQMRARFAVVLEFRDGRIAAQRNYDCFDPF